LLGDLDVGAGETLLVVSPHLDDAVLSAGGLIAAAASLGHPVVVATVFAGSPTAPVTSQFGRSLLEAWGLGEADPMAGRRAEDLRATAELGARAVHLPLLDALFRRDSSGAHLYEDVTDVFSGFPARGDPAIESARTALDEIVGDVQPALVIGPMGIGGHVDHVLVRDVVAALRPQKSHLLSYEDLPYASADVAIEVGLNRGLSPIAVLFEGHWTAKARAVVAYASQLPAVSWRTDALDDLHARALILGGSNPAELVWH
jgi:LmbE family N-acetylglucosaminyl deacetylase